MYLDLDDFWHRRWAQFMYSFLRHCVFFSKWISHKKLTVWFRFNRFQTSLEFCHGMCTIVWCNGIIAAKEVEVMRFTSKYLKRLEKTKFLWQPLFSATHLYAFFFMPCYWYWVAFHVSGGDGCAWSQLWAYSDGCASVTEVRQFLGFTNYFRRFIDHSSFIARPLEELTGKYARFFWSKQCHDAFAHLKESLTSAPVLHLPDVEREFRLITDASDSAVAGVLLQQDDDKEWHPVAFTSRRLQPEERNYHANEERPLQYYTPCVSGELTSSSILNCRQTIKQWHTFWARNTFLEEKPVGWTR